MDANFSLMVPYVLVTAIIWILIFYIIDVFFYGYKSNVKGSGNRTPFFALLIIIGLVIVPISSALYLEKEGSFTMVSEYLFGSGKEYEEENLRILALSRRLNSFSDMSISELQSVANELGPAISEARKAIAEQRTEIVDLQERLRLENDKTEEAIKIARNLSQIKIEQIEAIKKIITEDSRQGQMYYFILGVIVSLPLGVLASLVATWFYSRIAERRPQRTKHDNIPS